jgi:DNA/RNA endonuclease YhcR with UshA esterase domain
VSHPFWLQQLKPKPAAAAAEPADGPAKPEGVLTPAGAVKMVDKEVTVQFSPASGRSTGNRLFLNSEKDFRNDGNLAVMLTGKALSDKFKDATFDSFKGKTIRVKGTVKMYQNRPEIEVTDQSQITIVEK